MKASDRELASTFKKFDDDNKKNIANVKKNARAKKIAAPYSEACALYYDSKKSGEYTGD